MFFIFPKGPKAIPFVMILMGVVVFIASVIDTSNLRNSYKTENVFYSSSDEYDKCAEGTDFFVIEGLKPVNVHSKSDHGSVTHYLSEFKDATGSEHYIILNVSRDSSDFRELEEATSSDDYSVHGISYTGVFKLSSGPSTDVTYYGNIFDHNPLSDETHTRFIEFEPGSEDYEAFLSQSYKQDMTGKILLLAGSAVLTVLGIIIWRKLSVKRY